MTSWELACGKDITERWHMRCHCHYFSLWEITLPRDNVSYATVTAKHKSSMAGNSSIIVSLVALSSDRRQIPWNAVLQFLEINCLHRLWIYKDLRKCALSKSTFITDSAVSSTPSISRPSVYETRVSTSGILLLFWKK